MPSPFRELHTPGQPFIIPNPWDIGSAHILAGLGFKALASTSAGAAHAAGLADGGLGFEANLAHCATLVRATTLPVSADLEFGAGHSPEDAAITVLRAAEAGLAGCSIEDFGGDDVGLYDISLATDRIAAAAEAARALPGDFVLTARAEAFLRGAPDLGAVIARLGRFAEAGADVLYAPGLPDIDAIRSLSAEVPCPVNVLMGSPALPYTLADLAEAGVARVSLGSWLSRLAYGRVIRAAQLMIEEGIFDVASDAASFPELEAFFPPRV